VRSTACPPWRARWQGSVSILLASLFRCSQAGSSRYPLRPAARRRSSRSCLLSSQTRRLRLRRCPTWDPIVAWPHRDWHESANTNIITQMPTPTLPLDEMTVAEKLQLMEVLWEDLSKNPADLPSPEWHKEVLDECCRKAESGEEQFIDWEKAKQEILKRTS
jgi:hypothetical protein